MAETRPTVLFVDDEPLILRALARAFRRVPVEVLVSACPLAALELLAEQKADVIVSDFRMPALVGTEFLRRARAAGSSAIGIIVTGDADPAALRGAQVDGTIDVVFRKPWRDELLRTTVMQAGASRLADRARPSLIALG